MNRNAQDPRVVRTRQLLQTALLTLLREKPFQAISVGDITQHAKLNRTTFYLHYYDKFDMLAKTARDTFIQAIEGQALDWEQFRLENIKQLVIITCNYLEGFLKDCAPANKPYEPLIEAEMQQVLYDYLYCWLASLKGNPSETLAIEAQATVISAAILNISLKWSHQNTRYSKEQVAEEIHQVLAIGIRDYGFAQVK